MPQGCLGAVVQCTMWLMLRNYCFVDKTSSELFLWQLLLVFYFANFCYDGIFDVFILAMHEASKENLLVVRSESNGCEFVG